MKKFIFLVIFILPLVMLSAQSVTDYIHTAANFYINGEKKNAKQAIQNALNKYPNDPKVRQLADKINKLPDDSKDEKKQQKKDQNKDQNKDQQQDQKKDQNKDQQQQQQPQQQEPKMTKQNAQQILDALMQDEKNTQDKAKKQQVRGTRSADKDW